MNLTVSLRMNMTIEVNMSSHVAIVIAVDLLSAVICVARMARRELEGMNMVNLEPKTPPSLTNPKKRRDPRRKEPRGLRCPRRGLWEHVGRFEMGTAVNPRNGIAPRFWG
jgi:hypothetical protein